MKIDLKGKVALVTGGTRGIGRSVALMLGEAGAIVAVNYLKSESAAKGLAATFRKKHITGFFVQGDVSDYLAAEQVVHRVIERTKRLDIVVNNAGIWEPNPLENPRAEEAWDRTIKMNLKGTFNVCVHAAPYLKKSGSGRIINISSASGQRGEPKYSHYAASKGGVIALTKSLAVELAHHHVLVNCIAPGWVWTDMTAPVLKKPAKRKEILKTIPLGKVAQPEDVAASAVFLASPYASHITGEVLGINGGSVLSG